MPDPYTRLSLQGALPGGEVWSVNPAYIGNFDTTPPSLADLQTWADNVAADLPTLVGASLLGAMSRGATLNNVRATLYGSNGKIAGYADAPVTPPVTGGSQVYCPPTTAVALSLYSAIPGRSYRGRIYWPALSIGLDSETGRIPVATCNSLATDAVEMLSGIQDAAPASWEAVLGVWSTTRLAGVAVSQIRVGDIPDSQRRRRDALDEQRVIRPYPVP